MIIIVENMSSFWVIREKKMREKRKLIQSICRKSEWSIQMLKVKLFVLFPFTSFPRFISSRSLLEDGTKQMGFREPVHMKHCVHLERDLRCGKQPCEVTFPIHWFHHWFNLSGCFSLTYTGSAGRPRHKEASHRSAPRLKIKPGPRNDREASGEPSSLNQWRPLILRPEIDS